jgi:hypothetical protein
MAKADESIGLKILARMKRAVAPNGTAPLALRSATVERVAGRND